MSRSVVLIDSGGTNIGSVRYALERLGVTTEMTRDAALIRSAERVILPGVGAAAPGMKRLHDYGLVDVVRSLEQPVLGVCLGMQLLFDHSDESDTPCLGVVPGTVRLLAGGPGLRVPHMGWNRLRVVRDEPLLHGLPADAHAYFVHSYAAPVTDATLAATDHGEPFAAVVRSGNFHGMQFHPERSADVGALLLRNFLEL